MQNRQGRGRKTGLPIVVSTITWKNEKPDAYLLLFCLFYCA